MKKILLVLISLFLITNPLYAGGNRWTSKPPIGAQVDWGHPLSRGLVGCWLMNEGGGNIVKDIARNNNGKADFGCLSYFSNGIFVNSNSNQINLGNSYTANRNFSIVLQFMPIGPPATIYGHAMYQSYSYSYGMYITLYPNGTLHFIKSQIVDIGSGNLVDGYIIKNKYTIGFTIDNIGNYNLYDKGKNIKTGNTSQLFSLGYPRLGAEYGYPGGADVSNGYFYFCFIWNRALSPQEIKQLYIEPYCFIKPPTIWSNFKTAVAGATSNVFGWMSGNATQDIFGISD